MESKLNAAEFVVVMEAIGFRSAWLLFLVFQ
jgi:hypothetical protein